jgi:hypothetical protein
MSDLGPLEVVKRIYANGSTIRMDKFDRWLAEHDREVELRVFKDLRYGASTPYSFHPYLDSAIKRREQERGNVPQ